MIQESTISTLRELAAPLVKCGAISQHELDELQTLTTVPTDQGIGGKLPALVTQKEAAALLRVTPKTINDYVNSGRLIRKKLGRRSVRITLESLHRLVEES